MLQKFRFKKRVELVPEVGSGELTVFEQGHEIEVTRQDQIHTFFTDEPAGKLNRRIWYLDHKSFRAVTHSVG